MVVVMPHVKPGQHILTPTYVASLFHVWIVHSLARIESKNLALQTRKDWTSVNLAM